MAKQTVNLGSSANDGTGDRFAVPLIKLMITSTNCIFTVLPQVETILQ